MEKQNVWITRRVSMVLTFIRLGVNRVWLPTPLVVTTKQRKMEFSLSPFAPESWVSQVRFGYFVPRQP